MRSSVKWRGAAWLRSECSLLLRRLCLFFLSLDLGNQVNARIADEAVMTGNHPATIARILAAKRAVVVDRLPAHIVGRWPRPPEGGALVGAATTKDAWATSR